MVMVGGGEGIGPGRGNGPPDVGGGGPSGGTPGVARDFSVALVDSNNNLLLTLTPNDNQLYTSNVTYSIYWLDPNLFSQVDVYGQSAASLAGTTGLSIIQGRKKVVDVQGGEGVVSATVSYLPYVSGGWMYATVVPAGTMREYRLNGSNFVPVTVIGPSGAPPSSEAPTNCAVRFSPIPGRSNRLIQFSWQNAKPSTAGGTSLVKYIKIGASNYMDLNGAAANGAYRDLAVFLVTTAPGARQGYTAVDATFSSTDTAVELEQDVGLGVHGINWYFIPMTAALVSLDRASSPFVFTGSVN